MACLQIDGPIEAYQIVRTALGKLKPREERVIRLRHGIGNVGFSTDELTLDEIGQELGISKERVRQIHAKAFRHLSRIITRRSPAPVRTSLPRKANPELAQRRAMARALAKEREKQNLLELAEAKRKFRLAAEEAAAAELAKLTAGGRIIERNRRRLDLIVWSLLRGIPDAPNVCARVESSNLDLEFEICAPNSASLVKKLRSEMACNHIKLNSGDFHVKRWGCRTSLRLENGDAVLYVKILCVKYLD